MVHFKKKKELTLVNTDKEREFDDQSDYVKLLQRKIDNQLDNINNE